MSETTHKKSSQKAMALKMEEHMSYYTEVPEAILNREKYVLPNKKEVRAQMPGTIQEIFVKKGEKVETGDKLLILEAMKMRNQILSPINGTIKSIEVKPLDVVKNKALLIVFQ